MAAKKRKKADTQGKRNALWEIDAMLINRKPGHEIDEYIAEKYGYTLKTAMVYRHEAKKRWSKVPIDPDRNRRESIRHYKRLQYNLMQRLSLIPVDTQDLSQQRLAISLIKQSAVIEDKMSHILGIREIKVDGPIIQQNYVEATNNETTQILQITAEDLNTMGAHELAQLYRQYDLPSEEE